LAFDGGAREFSLSARNFCKRRVTPTSSHFCSGVLIARKVFISSYSNFLYSASVVWLKYVKKKIVNGKESYNIAHFVLFG
jgi:hypothetical protein